MFSKNRMRGRGDKYLKEKTRIRVIIVAITLCVVASLGFARFSFGAILPFMKEGLGFDYQQTGTVASGIFLGYLMSSFISGYVVLKYTAKRVILCSLILVAVSMVIISLSNHIIVAIFGSLLLGIGSGGANIPALGLIPRWFAPSRRGMAMGIANSGSGIGMSFSGMVVPLLIAIHPELGWRYSWWILAAFVMLIIMINSLFLKNDPGDVGMSPVGYSAVPTRNEDQLRPIKDYSSVYKNKYVWTIGICYFAWGFSYLTFSTFLVDYLMTDGGFQKEMAGSYFAIAGFASVFSGFIWGSLSDRFGRIQTLSFVYFFQASILVLIVTTNNSFLLLSGVILYGLSLWAVPTVTNVGISELVEPRFIPIAMGFLTLFFGVGQFISPIITGVLIDAANNYNTSFFLSATVVAAAGVISFLLIIKTKKQQLEIFQPKESKSSKDLKNY